MSRYGKLIRWLILTGALLADAASAATRQPSLATWVTRDLTPYVAEQLSAHPRFRHEPVRFVVMQNGNPQSTSNGLALSLRDELQQSLVDTPGIRIAWQPARSDINRNPGQDGIDCAADEVHYYVGLEVRESGQGEFEVEVRALDLEERSWVSGFGRSWRGAISASQHRAWRRYESDPSFLGDREVPYDDSQADLLAAHLAHELGCALLRQVSGEYVAELSRPDQRSPDEMLTLISNNLARYRALQLSPDESQTNSIIETTAHRIDEDLYQYWVTVRPKDASAELPALSASAYAYLPEDFITPTVVPILDSAARSRPNDLIASLAIVTPDDSRSCERAGSHRQHARLDTDAYYAPNASCHAIQAVTSSDSVIFFLQHQLNRGLVRLSDRACDRQTHARIARAGEPLDFALPADSYASASWLPAETWQVNPDTDVFYAIAVRDSRAARAVSKKVSELPQRCTASVRAGLAGRELERWLTDFAGLADRWPSQLDWQIIRVKSVY